MYPSKDVYMNIHSFFICTNQKPEIIQRSITRRMNKQTVYSTKKNELLINTTTERNCKIIVLFKRRCVLSAQSLSRTQLSATPRTVAHQAPLSMGFSRQEYWSGLPCPPPGDLPDPEIKPRSPTLQADSLPSEPQGKPQKKIRHKFLATQTLVTESDCLEVGRCKWEELQKSTRKLLKEMNTFIILTLMMVSWLYTYAKISEIFYFKYI